MIIIEEKMKYQPSTNHMTWNEYQIYTTFDYINRLIIINIHSIINRYSINKRYIYIYI